MTDLSGDNIGSYMFLNESEGKGFNLITIPKLLNTDLKHEMNIGNTLQLEDGYVETTKQNIDMGNGVTGILVEYVELVGIDFYYSYDLYFEYGDSFYVVTWSLYDISENNDTSEIVIDGITFK